MLMYNVLTKLPSVYRLIFHQGQYNLQHRVQLVRIIILKILAEGGIWNLFHVSSVYMIGDKLLQIILQLLINFSL